MGLPVDMFFYPNINTIFQGKTKANKTKQQQQQQQNRKKKDMKT